MRGSSGDAPYSPTAINPLGVCESTNVAAICAASRSRTRVIVVSNAISVKPSDTVRSCAEVAPGIAANIANRETHSRDANARNLDRVVFTVFLESVNILSYRAGSLNYRKATAVRCATRIQSILRNRATLNMRHS